MRRTIVFTAVAHITVANHNSSVAASVIVLMSQRQCVMTRQGRKEGDCTCIASLVMTLIKSSVELLSCLIDTTDFSSHDHLVEEKGDAVK